MPSRSSPSTGPPRDTERRPDGVDVYLFPAVVGGGLGDIEEVLSAGRYLARARFPVTVFRRAGRPLPRGLDGPWEWPPHRRTVRVEPVHAAALTVTPAWGVSAAPPSSGPLGGPGPWSVEAAEVERRYGSDRTVHASLEEFARTLPLAEESRERWREGGTRAREIGARRRTDPEGDRFARAFRRFRAFDRPNVLHLFAGFAPTPAFSREFPEAVQTGPLWPFQSRSTRPAPRRGARTWFWYASPASAEALAPAVLAGLRRAEPPVRLLVRSPRPWRAALAPASGEVEVAPIPERRWRARFDAAEVRIVTGSRTLLDAIAAGRPFLYFNGVLGSGAARRRHRPEKIRALLRLGRAERWPGDLLRDLADFARGRRVEGVVARAVTKVGAWGRPFPSVRLRGYPPDRADLGRYLVKIAHELSRPASSARELVARERSRRS